ncbi:azurin [Limibacter armeniacum]|uniref:azurin n=1 Tax=Limibacter armeniacum TaxID=466084 RepID=UPI002FE64BA9
MKITLITSILCVGATILVSCNNKDKKHDVGAKANVSTTEKRKNVLENDTIRVTVNSNDKMQFDKSKIVVGEYSTVVLTLNHTGKMPVTAMGHNFVLLGKGTQISDFARDAIQAKESQYIPSSQKKNIIAYTDLIGGGETSTITFKAPIKGTYDFICSFPGHYSIMKGKFIVE